jgi:hypothetical protein
MVKRHRLNAQGLARRDKGLMDKIVSEPGRTLVSIDLSAGEPSVTANFSNDTNYRWATLDGVGKAPKYVNNVLMIDDIYLMTASASPMFSDTIREAFDRDWDGKTFVEQWLADSEAIKGALKKTRQISKILCLGEDALIAVKGKGYKSIKDVTAEDLVWDGESWVQTQGAIYKGTESVIVVSGVHITPTHKVLTDDGWKEAQAATSLETKNPPTHSWTDVWKMASRVFRSKEIRRVPLYLCRFWCRSGMEKLRQLKER